MLKLMLLKLMLLKLLSFVTLHKDSTIVKAGTEHKQKKLQQSISFCVTRISRKKEKYCLKYVQFVKKKQKH